MTFNARSTVLVILALITTVLTMTITSRAQAQLSIPLELFRASEPRSIPAQIPRESNSSVQRWVRYFALEDRARFGRFMSRGALYQNLIQDILIENGVPAEMYYLAMIESGFSRRARSSAQAVGVWQFGAATARLYGLRVDREVDERMDIIRATRAAAHHLRSLRAEFGNWNMAMAAYNCGIGCARRAARVGRSHDFWEIERQGLWPSETANYVPKFQAAMSIAHDPRHFGFRERPTYQFPMVQRLHVAGRVHIADIARRQRIPTETLISLNPHLLQGSTPSSRRGYEVWLPRFTASRN